MRIITAVLVAGSVALGLSACNPVDSVTNAITGAGAKTYNMDEATAPSLYNMKGFGEECEQAAKNNPGVENFGGAVAECGKTMVGTTITLHGKVMSITPKLQNLPSLVSVGKDGFNDTLDGLCTTAAECDGIQVGDNVYIVVKLVEAKDSGIPDYPADMPATVVASIDKQ